MTDEEKAEHQTHETTGGYLKVLDEAESSQDVYKRQMQLFASPTIL